MNQSRAGAPLPDLRIRVGGLVPLSTADFPGQLAAVVFLQGCPWRCGYCHNPHLIPVDAPAEMGWRQVREFLVHRRGLLDAVVFSGGEPTFQSDLPQAMALAKEMGFKVGLHTGGSYPAHLKKLLPFCDWVGMDIKAGFEDYTRITGVDGSGAKARESASLLLASGVDYEFRTTVHPLLLSENQVLEIGQGLAALGAKRYVVQVFRAHGCANTALNDFVGRQSVIGGSAHQSLARLFPEFSVRCA